MKKIFLLIALALFTGEAMTQQNVGIGTTTPTEKLDVAGNMNVTGQIKLNGEAGNPGDVMKINASGNPVWDAASRFTTFGEYYNSPGAYNLPVPDSVKQVMIECWGAGGGGAQAGGGAAGSYAMGIFNINGTAPTLEITVGLSGLGAVNYTDAGTAGGFSQVQITGASLLNVYAIGGRAANQYYPGLGFVTGFVVSGSQKVQGFGINGETGYTTTQSTYPVSASAWHTAVKFGSGGTAALGIGIGGKGSFRIHNVAIDPSGSAELLYQGGYAGFASGGGGGQRLGYGWGWDGGNGYVIVRW